MISVLFGDLMKVSLQTSFDKKTPMRTILQTPKVKCEKPAPYTKFGRTHRVFSLS